MISATMSHSTMPPHDCDRMQIHAYELREVMLPAAMDRPARKATAVVVRGRNFTAGAQPLLVTVGGIPLRYLRIAPDERSVEGVLLEEPPAGALVEVRLGDADFARGAAPFAPEMIRRIG